ncbi:MAG: hypothetical protein FWH21_04085, partial [Kiritimatiellaeota bacterium]|nr:hypothetical protein [Kiritimatiellota bacterium]
AQAGPRPGWGWGGGDARGAPRPRRHAGERPPARAGPRPGWGRRGGGAPGGGPPPRPPPGGGAPPRGRPPAPDGEGGGGTPVEATPPERPPSAFSTATEQVLGWIANTVPGAPPPILPALPPGERENIAAILDRDIVLYADDSDRAAESKHNVAHAKQLLKRYLAEGGTPEDFLGYYHNALAEAHREWREAQRGVVELQRAGDEEGAVTFYLEQNAALGERGIKPVILPPALRHLLGEGEE